MSVLPVHVPTKVLVGTDVGATIHDAAARVLAILDERPDATFDEIDDLRRRWEAFVAATDARRRSGSHAVQAVARRIDVEMGRRLASMAGDEIPDVVRPDLHILRTMAKYADVVWVVIDQSDNSRPPSRNRCLSAIRWHREMIGEAPTTGRRRGGGRYSKPLRPPTGVKLSRPDAENLARRVRGDTSIVYGLIRQALKAHEAIANPADGFHHLAIGEALVTAEEHTVALLQAERRRP